MSRYRAILRVIVAVLLTAPPGATFLNLPNIPAANLLRMEEQVHRYVNRKRFSMGIPELSWSEPVAAEARRHAGNIAVRGPFAHEDPLRGNIDMRLDSAGIGWRRCAENLYEANFGNPAKDAVQAWLDSPAHRKNLTDSMFSDAGVGIAQRSDGWIIVVQEYIQK